MHHVKVIRSIPVIVGKGAPTFATAGEWKTIDEDDEELIQESCLFLADHVQEVYDFSYWKQMSEDCIYSVFEWAEDGPVLQEVWRFREDGTWTQTDN